MKNINAEVVIATYKEMMDRGLIPNHKCIRHEDDDSEVLVWRYDSLTGKKKHWMPFIKLETEEREDSTHKFLDYYISDKKRFGDQILDYYPFARLLGEITGIEVEFIGEKITAYDLLKKEMYEAHRNGTAKILTIELARQLKGKRIKTIYFGYDGQDGFDDFVVGELRTKYDKMMLYTEDGRNTHMYHDNGSPVQGNGELSCTDIDRYVFFIEA